MIAKLKTSYIALSLILLALGLAFLNFSAYRILLASLMGAIYFFWGVFTHWKDNTNHLIIVLEYLGISLLAVTILIFISLRA